MKAHYRQPDWQLYEAQLTGLLGRIKSIALQGGGSTRKYGKKTGSFFLSASNDWEVSSSVIHELQSLVAKTYVTAVDDGSGTGYLVTQ